MKKVIIIAAVIALLAAASALLVINKNNTASAETTVVMSLGDFDFSASYDLTQDERDTAVRMDKENRIAEMLSELDRVNSAKVNISSDNSSVTAVLDISEDLSQDKTDAVLQVITMYLNGIEKDDIVITDQNNNVIYPLSE